MRRPLQWLARLPQWSVTPDDSLVRSLAFLGVDVTPTTVARAGHGGAIAVIALGTPVLFALPPGLRTAGAAWFCLLAVAVAIAIARTPVFLAAVRRTSALGEAPDLISRAVLRMRVEPTTESAIAFAVRTGDGPLADSLEEFVRRTRGSPASGLAAFADAWADWFPALRRSAMLVEAAGAAPQSERSHTLDRAMTAVLDGTRDRMAAFATELHGPATALYAFGVLLPLALVAVLPAARVAGIEVTMSAVVVLYDALLPLVLLAASAWLLARRPVAFAPPQISHMCHLRPGRRWLVPAVGGFAAVLAGVGAAWRLPSWAVPLAITGVGVGVSLVGWYRPAVLVHRRIRAVESELPDALYLVGRRIRDGRAVEAAISHAASEVGGATGKVFAAAARRQRQLRVGVREAFLGEYGALSTLSSPRTRSTVDLLAIAAREGRPAGIAIVAMADHIEELRSVERNSRREIRRVTATFSNTAAVFGPLVAGTTVALADSMEGLSLGGEATSTLSTANLGLAVGAYVLVLSVVLTGLSTGLERGLDRALVGYRVGFALLSATTVYLLTFAVVTAFV